MPPTTKYQHHLSGDGKLGAGQCCASTDMKLKSNQLICTPQLPELVSCSQIFVRNSLAMREYA